MVRSLPFQGSVGNVLSGYLSLKEPLNAVSMPRNGGSMRGVARITPARQIGLIWCMLWKDTRFIAPGIICLGQVYIQEPPRNDMPGVSTGNHPMMQQNIMPGIGQTAYKRMIVEVGEMGYADGNVVDVLHGVFLSLDNLTA